MIHTTRGIVSAPIRLVLYGTDGVGKTTFASQAPAPVFLPVEDGCAQLDVARLEAPRTWGQAMASLRLLETEQHDFRTVVVDTIDWLERLCWEHVCAAAGVKSIEDVGGGYGKGYLAALNEWSLFCDALDRLRAKGMGSILLAHAAVRTFKNPNGADYDKWNLALHEKSAGKIRGWADVVGFAQYVVFAVAKGRERAKAVGDGARVLSCVERPAWYGKNRYDLPAEMPLDYETFAAACTAKSPQSPKALLEAISEASKGLPDETRKAVFGAAKRAAGNGAELARILDKVSAMVGIDSNSNSNEGVTK